MTQPVNLTKRQKAAIVVRLLRSEGIDLSLAQLPDDMQVDLAREMGNLRFISRDTLREVVEEFVAELDAIGLSFSGGIGSAFALLEGALSAGAEERLRIEAGRASMTDAWERLSQLDVDRLVPVLAEESVEIGAVALSKLKVSKAADILGRLPGDKARRLAYAMGQTGGIGPDTVARIGRALMEQFDAEPARAFTGGPVERVGAVLNSSPAATRDDVLDGLDEEDKGFADEVRKAIFTFLNIPDRIDPRDIPKVVREIDPVALTTALAYSQGRPREERAAEFILKNMSQRLAQQLRDEMEGLGKIKQKDAEEAMSAVVASVRAMEADGQLMLVSNDE